MSALPTSKLERWKYSNLPAFVRDTYTDVPLSVGYEGDDLFVVGDDVTIMPWAQDDYHDMDLWTGLDDVLSLVIPSGQTVDKPVHLSSETASGIKTKGHINLVIKKDAQVTVYDDLNIDGWCVRSINIILEEGAKLTHIRTGLGQGVVTQLTQIQQAKGSIYSAYALNTYSHFMRDQIHVKLQGEDAKCYLSGSKLLSDKQHCDTCILIEHEAPNCYSNQNYRNILNDQSRGVFQGKVHVHQIAQQTDGYQLCNSVLLSDKCEMDTKPELEIYADDVKCSHGATTAQLDADPLFYLKARGIPEDQARALLLQAFVNESLETFEDNEDIYEWLGDKIERTLSL
jgi:Fe-S cluster assembly protein SufD